MSLLLRAAPHANTIGKERADAGEEIFLREIGSFVSRSINSLLSVHDVHLSAIAEIYVYNVWIASRLEHHLLGSCNSVQFVFFSYRAYN